MDKRRAPADRERRGVARAKAVAMRLLASDKALYLYYYPSNATDGEDHSTRFKMKAPKGVGCNGLVNISALLFERLAQSSSRLNCQAEGRNFDILDVSLTDLVAS